MKLNRTKNEMDREARNDENENWDELEQLWKKVDDLVLEGLDKSSSIISSFKNIEIGEGSYLFVLDDIGAVTDKVISKKTQGKYISLSLRLNVRRPITLAYFYVDENSPNATINHRLSDPKVFFDGQMSRATFRLDIDNPWIVISIQNKGGDAIIESLVVSEFI